MSQLRAQFQETLNEKEAEYQAKIAEIAANNDQGTYSWSGLRWIWSKLYLLEGAV